MNVFLDADFYIALSHQSDSLHERALVILKKLSNATLFTSWDVIDEVSTKLRYMISKKEAERFLTGILVSTTQIVFPTPKNAHQALKLFQTIQAKHTSLTDCMNMAIMIDKGITTIASFDKIYPKQGFALLK